MCFKRLWYLCQMELFCMSLHIWVPLHAIFFFSLTDPHFSGHIYAAFFPWRIFQLCFVLGTSFLITLSSKLNCFPPISRIYFIFVYAIKLFLFSFYFSLVYFLICYSELLTENLSLFSNKNIIICKVYHAIQTMKLRPKQRMYF